MCTKRLSLAIAICVVGSACSPRTLSTAKLRAPEKFRYDVYTVRNERSLKELEDDFGIPTGILSVVNHIREDRRLESGQSIILPFFNEVYPFKRSTSKTPTGRPAAKFSQVLLSDATARYARSLVWPVLGGQISSNFGRRGRSYHEGVDIQATEGVPVFAAHDGVVAYSGNDLRGYGNLLILRGDGVTTVYGHNKANIVFEGERVRKGTPIAAVGKTGKATGPHLHFEVRLRNIKGEYVAVDPLYFYSVEPVVKARTAKLS